MMKDEFYITYIDDDPDIYLSKYLGEYGDKSIIYKELVFDPEKGYKSLINSSIVKKSNLIIIDSRLYENNSIKGEKFTGEELKILIKRFFPFIEIIVITQNGDMGYYGTISKYQYEKNNYFVDYYNKYLKPFIESARGNIKYIKRINKKFLENENWGDEIKESIDDNIKGLIGINNLSSKDIDKLIKKFIEIEEILNDKGL